MDIQEIIRNQYKTIPDDVKEAIQSTDLEEKFDTIAKKHSLHIDQIGSLQTETLLVMIGIEFADDYVDNLVRELGVSKEEAAAIAEDVNREILGSIRSSLRQIQEKEMGSENLSEKEGASMVPTQTPSSVPPIITPYTIPSIEKAGDFTIEKRVPSTSTQYKDTNLNKDDILKEIEQATHPKPTDPLVDHLLKNPVSVKKEVEVKKIDPYREPAE